MPDEALGKRLLIICLVMMVPWPIGYGLGNCVEGPLLECLDLFVVQGMRCTGFFQGVSTDTGSRISTVDYMFDV